MADNNVQGLLGVSMEKIREMVDVNTVVGDPIRAGDGVTLIPVSKISYGFAAGGSNLPTKSPNELFGGGSGAGINITPIAFVVVSEKGVQILPVAANPDSNDKILTLIPEMFDKVTDFLKKKKESEKGTDSEPASADCLP